MPPITDLSRLVLAVAGASALLMLLGLLFSVQAFGAGQTAMGVLNLGWTLIAGRMFFVSTHLLGGRW